MSGEEQGLEDRISEELAEELPFVDAATDEGPSSLRDVVKRSLITGAAIFIPLAVTFLVIGFVVNFLSNSLDPLVGGLATVPGIQGSVVLKVLILLAIVVLIPVVGFVAEFSQRGSRLGDEFDDFMTSIPGIGSVYSSFNDMSELLLDSDTESFQEVKLVEYPTDGSYVVAFKTAETPRVVGEATGHDDMVTLFMPMAPNPVMGGFVLHVSRERVVDVDMSVEQGIRSIVTSGVAFGDEDHAVALSEDQMRQLGYIDQVDRQTAPGSAPRVGPAGEAVDGDRSAAYDRNVSPEYAETPDKIAERERPAERGDATEATPEELADRDAADRESTDAPPEELAGGEDADDDASGPDDAGR